VAVKVERGHIAEALRAAGRDDDARRAHHSLPPQVDTELHRDALLALGLDPDRLLEHLGRGGLGKMIGG
jgi:hypothetical protein